MVHHYTCGGHRMYGFHWHNFFGSKCFLIFLCYYLSLSFESAYGHLLFISTMVLVLYGNLEHVAHA